MDIEQCKETYEMLKKGKQFIANIDKDFFLKFAEILFNELENKQDDINILQAQRDSMEYQFKQAKAELEKKEKQIDLMAEQLAGLAIFDIEKDEPLVLGDKEEVKEYFTKKVEKEGVKDEQSR